MFSPRSRSLREGHDAWLRGDLDLAVERLEACRRARAGLADALFPLARALSERGEPERALAALDEALASAPASEAGRLFRALILIDHGRAAETLRDLEALAPRNVLAGGLRALSGWPENEGGEASRRLVLPPGALWLADVAGRILARLEMRFFRERPEEALDHHHKLYAGDPPPPSAREPFAARCIGKAERVASALPRPLRSLALGLLEVLRRLRVRPSKAEGDPVLEAFASKRFDEVERLVAALPFPTEGLLRRLLELLRRLALRPSPPRRDVDSEVFLGIALLARGEEAKALRHLADARRRHPDAADIHFIEGLCHARAGKAAEAAWSFVRAARLDDVGLNEVLGGVARKLGVEIGLAGRTG
ncbi:MAG: tetratricopeptide repeat protein [Planctomycetes bacterium]|nr:tetratricopeptide repeat protein [Planctomycetota bacterium]